MLSLSSLCNVRMYNNIKYVYCAPNIIIYEPVWSCTYILQVYSVPTFVEHV